MLPGPELAPDVEDGDQPVRELVRRQVVGHEVVVGLKAFEHPRFIGRRAGIELDGQVERIEPPANG
jgi:hypothetical protein